MKIKIKTLPQNTLKNFEIAFRNTMGIQINPEKYSVYKCRNCGLRFKKVNEDIVNIAEKNRMIKIVNFFSDKSLNCLFLNFNKIKNKGIAKVNDTKKFCNAIECVRKNSLIW